MDRGLDPFARAFWLTVGASAGLAVLIDEPDFVILTQRLRILSRS
jgi:hypothetical protein